MDLARKSCVPRAPGEAPFAPDAARLLAQDVPGWTLEEHEHRLVREYRFPDFAATMKFAGRVAKIAEKQDHHPDMHISYDRLTLVLWTHSIGGLSENDFILAARINALKEPGAA